MNKTDYTRPKLPKITLNIFPLKNVTKAFAIGKKNSKVNLGSYEPQAEMQFIVTAHFRE